MSTQRIVHPRSGTYGWQARAYIAPGERLTRFFADDAHGGIFAALKAAVRAEGKLKREARRIRRERGL